VLTKAHGSPIQETADDAFGTNKLIPRVCSLQQLVQQKQQRHIAAG